MNVNWIIFKKQVSNEQIQKDLQEIIEQRFDKDAVSSLSTEYGSEGYWEFNDDKHGYVSITLKEPDKICFKPGVCFESSYAECVLRNELGKLYNGICGGEFDEEEQWKPEPEKYPDFQTWQKLMRLL